MTCRTSFASRRAFSRRGRRRRCEQNDGDTWRSSLRLSRRWLRVDAVDVSRRLVQSWRPAWHAAISEYLLKVGGRGVVVGLSGGIDSAVTAALAVRALGREHVHGLAMPSEFSSDHSLDDARE
ncbi:MAG: hypothetical protein IV100_09375, partial [Myxococcales bacterium]|nr:hypothetical protein [Myxococcales bacterium]